MRDKCVVDVATTQQLIGRIFVARSAAVLLACCFSKHTVIKLAPSSVDRIIVSPAFYPPASWFIGFRKHRSARYAYTYHVESVMLVSVFGLGHKIDNLMSLDSVTFQDCAIYTTNKKCVGGDWGPPQLTRLVITVLFNNILYLRVRTTTLEFTAQQLAQSTFVYKSLSR